MQTTILFISGGEIFVILLAILLLFGADKIPDIARTLGKGVKQIRTVTDDLKKDFEKTDLGKDIKDINKEFQEVKKNLDFTTPTNNTQNKKINDLDNSIK